VFRLALPIAAAADIKPEDAEQKTMSRKTGISILLIDDDETVHIGTQQQLTVWGFGCDAVESIDEALIAAQKHSPSMVVSDYRLRENRTGADAIARITRNTGKPAPARSADYR